MKLLCAWLTAILGPKYKPSIVTRIVTKGGSQSLITSAWYVNLSPTPCKSLAAKVLRSHKVPRASTQRALQLCDHKKYALCVGSGGRRGDTRRPDPGRGG